MVTMVGLPGLSHERIRFWAWAAMVKQWGSILMYTRPDLHLWDAAALGSKVVTAGIGGAMYLHRLAAMAQQWGSYYLATNP